MKTILLISTFVLSTIVNAQNTWLQKADYGGDARHAAVGFVIGTKAYIGTGTDDNIFFSDLWEWDQTNDTWTQKKSFPGAARREAVAFSIGTKGFIGTGCCPGYSDFWEYDSKTDTWTAIAPFPGGQTMTGIAFSIGGKGYVGLGDDGGQEFSQKIYEYDTLTENWTQKADFPGAGRTDALGFSMNGKGYVAIGDDGTLPMLKDFWEYDPTNDTWTQKADFQGGPRTTAAGFAIASISKAYIGTGDDDSGLFSDFWEWDIATDTWSQKLDFGGGVRTDETGFSIGNKGYIVLGQLGAPPEFNELWEYTPLTTGINDIISSDLVTIFPNPFSTQAVFKIQDNFKNATLIVYNSIGKEVKQIKDISGHTFILQRDNILRSGLYFIRLTEGSKTIATEMLIITD